MAQYIKLQNTSDVTQQVVVRGKLYALPPFAIEDVLYSVASEFMDKRGKYVREWMPVKIPEIQEGERSVWLANVTGNPFLPEKVQVTRVRKGEEVVIELDNEVRKAAVVSQMYDLGQRENEGPGGIKEWLNLPKKRVSIPPYTRVRMGHRLAEWFLRRDAMQEKQHIGKVRMCRAPSSFEPNITWELDSIRRYAKIMNPDTFYGDDVLGPSQSDIVVATGSEEEMQDAITNAKRILLSKLFFTLIDERYSALNQGEFEAIERSMIAKSKPVIRAADPAVELPPRRRGRPKKAATAEA